MRVHHLARKGSCAASRQRDVLVLARVHSGANDQLVKGMLLRRTASRRLCHEGPALSVSSRLGALHPDTEAHRVLEAKVGNIALDVSLRLRARGVLAKGNLVKRQVGKLVKLLGHLHAEIEVVLTPHATHCVCRLKQRHGKALGLERPHSLDASNTATNHTNSPSATLALATSCLGSTSSSARREGPRGATASPGSEAAPACRGQLAGKGAAEHRVARLAGGRPAL
mmetsp:Transcript_24210/g.46915  ORF Transcript_24210/g.46915 Transcript_24210/m.46915 type:complete len:226 (-) Transcript_24210:988-1665(-)